MISLKKVPQAIYCFIFLLVYYVKKIFALSKNLNNLSYQKNEIQESLEIKLLFETKKNKAKKEKDQIEKLVEELTTNDNDQSTKENLLVTLLQNNYQQQINHKACFINEEEDEEEENENEKENRNINNFKNKEIEIEIEIENENKNENKNEKEKEKEKEKKKQTKPDQNKTDLLFFKQQFGVNGKEKKQLSRWLHLKKLIDPMLNYIFKNIKCTTGGSVINYNKWYKELERSNQEEEEQQKKKIEKRSLFKKKTKQEIMEEQQTHFFQRLQQQRSQYFTKKNLAPYNNALMEEINSLKTFRLDLHLSSEMQDLNLGDEIMFFQNCINNLTLNFDKQCIFFYYFNFQQIGKQIYEQVSKIITDYETKFKSKLKLDNDFNVNDPLLEYFLTFNRIRAKELEKDQVKKEMKFIFNQIPAFFDNTSVIEKCFENLTFLIRATLLSSKQNEIIFFDFPLNTKNDKMEIHNLLEFEKNKICNYLYLPFTPYFKFTPQHDITELKANVVLVNPNETNLIEKESKNLGELLKEKDQEIQLLQQKLKKNKKPTIYNIPESESDKEEDQDEDEDEDVEEKDESENEEKEKDEKENKEKDNEEKENEYQSEDEEEKENEEKENEEKENKEKEQEKENEEKETEYQSEDEEEKENEEKENKEKENEEKENEEKEEEEKENEEKEKQEKENEEKEIKDQDDDEKEKEKEESENEEKEKEEKENEESENQEKENQEKENQEKENQEKKNKENENEEKENEEMENGEKETKNVKREKNEKIDEEK
ncbi:serine/arginine repetitive matrix [Anaeramoeba flamelloides]|uniref:Serine/arginine repetitive matrix n=1 Tax=Anaeramoeba flamelloides TaxID=1746091 RepID=A0AAV7Z3M8_9EUKA|nr:serine/arginine repetitive matrix [Anaeramoeba flamelloides]